MYMRLYWLSVQMSNLIKIILIIIVLEATQTVPVIDIDASIVNGVFSVYFQDIPGIRSVSFVIDYKSSNITYYTIGINNISPTNGYWIFGTNIEYASAIYNIEVIEIHVTVRTGTHEYKHLMYGCWNELSNSNCNAVKVTTSYGIAYYCKKDFVFKEEFVTENAVDLFKWKKEIRHYLYSNVEEFVVFNNSNENAFIKDHQLHIRPRIVEGDLRMGHIDLGEDCTSEIEHCYLKIDAPYKVLPPVSSALLKSKNQFSLSNLCIDIRAKLPKGDWLLPHIWLQSCRFNYCSGIRIAFARGNEILEDNENSDVSGNLLLAGLVVWNKWRQPLQLLKNYRHPKGQHFGDNFHVYSFYMNMSNIGLAVDNDAFGEININDLNDDFKQFINKNLHEPEFRIALGVSVGGHLDFKNISSKPWTDLAPNATLNFYRNEKWRQTWQGDEALIVDYVHVFKKRSKLNYYKNSNENTLI